APALARRRGTKCREPETIGRGLVSSWAKFFLSVRGYRGELLAGENCVDDTVLLRLFGEHPIIALGVSGDLLVVLARVLGQDRVELFTILDDEPGLDLEIGRLDLCSIVGLVQLHPGMREFEPLALSTPGQQNRGRRRRHAHADGVYVGADVLHRVVDGEQRSDGATGRVDVE